MRGSSIPRAGWRRHPAKIVFGITNAFRAVQTGMCPGTQQLIDGRCQDVTCACSSDEDCPGQRCVNCMCYDRLCEAIKPAIVIRNAAASRSVATAFGNPVVSRRPNDAVTALTTTATEKPMKAAPVPMKKNVRVQTNAAAASKFALMAFSPAVQRPPRDQKCAATALMRTAMVS